jgi:16S rRNA G1207 methylase RsmC
MPENQEILKNIKGFRLIGSDFLKSETSQWDHIIANPPFSKNQDIDHITKMWKHLKDGGRLVSVASKHWQLSQNKREKTFATFLSNMDAEIHEIEAGRFKESGTMVSCCVIVLNK